MYGQAAEKKRRERALSKDPAIEVNQRWVSYDRRGEVFRRLRIIAKHPDENFWIVQDEPARVYHFTGDLRTIPEFNLRYVFELENDENR